MLHGRIQFGGLLIACLFAVSARADDIKTLAKRLDAFEKQMDVLLKSTSAQEANRAIAEVQKVDLAALQKSTNGLQDRQGDLDKEVGRLKETVKRLTESEKVQGKAIETLQKSSEKDLDVSEIKKELAQLGELKKLDVKEVGEIVKEVKAVKLKSLKKDFDQMKKDVAKLKR